MRNASEMKDMLSGNLFAGAVLGTLLAGLFACHAIAPENNAEFFQSAARDGLPLWAANALFAASLALMCTVPFGFGLFLPLGRSVIKRARDRCSRAGWSAASPCSGSSSPTSPPSSRSAAPWALSTLRTASSG